MKPALFIACLLLYAPFGFSHTTKEDFDYSIVFGGCFEKDIVSLKINNTSIFDHYKVENKDALKKGNLSLTQGNKGISIFYNRDQKFKRKINFSFYLDIDLKVNDKMNKFKIDLRKGKVILIEFCPNPHSSQKKLTIEQLNEPVILM